MIKGHDKLAYMNVFAPCTVHFNYCICAKKGFDSGIVIVVFNEIFRFINIANSVSNADRLCSI